MRDVDHLNEVVGAIGEKEGRMDGLLAAAGIQQETSALEYEVEDARRMMDVNVTGVFMTAQAVARTMVKLEGKDGGKVNGGRGGSMAFVASMSGTVANRVSRSFLPGAVLAVFVKDALADWTVLGFDLSRIQCE